MEFTRFNDMQNPPNFVVVYAEMPRIVMLPGLVTIFEEYNKLNLRDALPILARAPHVFWYDEKLGSMLECAVSVALSHRFTASDGQQWDSYDVSVYPMNRRGEKIVGSFTLKVL